MGNSILGLGFMNFTGAHVNYADQCVTFEYLIESNEQMCEYLK